MHGSNVLVILNEPLDHRKLCETQWAFVFGVLDGYADHLKVDFDLCREALSKRTRDLLVEQVEFGVGDVDEVGKPVREQVSLSEEAHR